MLHLAIYLLLNCTQGTKKNKHTDIKTEKNLINLASFLLKTR